MISHSDRWEKALVEALKDTLDKIDALIDEYDFDEALGLIDR